MELGKAAASETADFWKDVLMFRARFFAATALVATSVIACGSSVDNGAYQPPPLPGLDGSADGSGGTIGSGGEGGAPGTDGAAGGQDGSPGGQDGSPGTLDGSSPTTPTTCPETFTLPDNGYANAQLETDYDLWKTPIPLTKSGP